MSASAYECTFRHVAFVLTSICVLMVVMFAGIAAAVTFIADGKTILSVILYLVGAIVAYRQPLTRAELTVGVRHFVVQVHRR